MLNQGSLKGMTTATAAGRFGTTETAHAGCIRRFKTLKTAAAGCIHGFKTLKTAPEETLSKPRRSPSHRRGERGENKRNNNNN